MKLKFKRLLSTLVDYIIIFYLLYLLLYLVDIFVKNDIVSMVVNVLWVILIIVLILVKDCIFGYNSIGKKNFGLTIVTNDKRSLTKKELVDRNVASFWFVAFYVFTVLYNNKSAGDMKYNTSVVERK